MKTSQCAAHINWKTPQLSSVLSQAGADVVKKNISSCVRRKGERKPNFVFATCVFRVGVPAYGYAEFFEIAVRTPKWLHKQIAKSKVTWSEFSGSRD